MPRLAVDGAVDGVVMTAVDELQCRSMEPTVHRARPSFRGRCGLAHELLPPRA